LNDQRIVGLDIEPFWRHRRERNRILSRFDDILAICHEAGTGSRGQLLPLVWQERHFPHRKGFGVCEAGIEVHHLNRHIFQRDATFLLLNLRSEAHRVHIDEIDEARGLDKGHGERKIPCFAAQFDDIGRNVLRAGNEARRAFYDDLRRHDFIRIQFVALLEKALEGWADRYSFC